MSKGKGIKPRNSKGEAHGLWETYWFNGDLMYKSFYHNGRRMGYEENYWGTNTLVKKRYHL
jgi:antitoxin component YwqK of YwqJK toxin-antitoxin module